MAERITVDKNKAVNTFLERFESLSRLPLISEDEMRNLYGAEVYAALRILQDKLEQMELCSNCENRCCKRVRCEFYSDELTNCIIYKYRPLLCRMHFCNRLGVEHAPLIKEIGDIFLEGLQAAEPVNKKKAQLFDAPPLKQHIPHLVSFFKEHFQLFERSEITEKRLHELITAEIENDRIR
jgi:Fe-S-cluster containining protein